jgi:hypothetical protein
MKSKRAFKRYLFELPGFIECFVDDNVELLVTILDIDGIKQSVKKVFLDDVVKKLLQRDPEIKDRKIAIHILWNFIEIQEVVFEMKCNYAHPFKSTLKWPHYARGLKYYFYVYEYYRDIIEEILDIVKEKGVNA